MDLKESQESNAVPAQIDAGQAVKLEGPNVGGVPRINTHYRGIACL